MGEWVHLDVDLIVAETDLALLARLSDEWDNREVWLPKGQVADAGRYVKGDRDLTLSVTGWVAEKKGLA